MTCCKEASFKLTTPTLRATASIHGVCRHNHFATRALKLEFLSWDNRINKSRSSENNWKLLIITGKCPLWASVLWSRACRCSFVCGWFCEAREDDKQTTTGGADSRAAVIRDQIDYCLCCDVPSAGPESASQEETKKSPVRRTGALKEKANSQARPSRDKTTSVRVI